jgi:serine/threonine-protein kinase
MEVSQTEEILEKYEFLDIVRFRPYIDGVTTGQTKLPSKSYLGNMQNTLDLQGKGEFFLEKSNRYAIMKSKIYDFPHNLLRGGAFSHVGTGLDVLKDVPVFIKFLKPKYKDTPDNMYREASFLASLSHPNLPLGHELIALPVPDPDTPPFLIPGIIMEYVKGKRLDSIIDFERSVDYLVGIASALDYIHSQGLIHNDVKSANIAIDSKDDIAKLLDLGSMSGHLNDEDKESYIPPSVTTFLYSSPELIQNLKYGDWHPQVTGKSDQHALAITIYRQLWVSQPWEGSSGLDYFHEEVLRKATSFNPEDRYSTCTEFIQAFQSAGNEN